MKAQISQKYLNHRAKALENLLNSDDTLNYQGKNNCNYYRGQWSYKIAVDQFREIMVKHGLSGMKAIANHSYFII